MTTDSVDEIKREMERNALRFQNGLKLALGAPFARVGPTPRRTVFSRGKVELWRYDSDAVTLSTPIFLVPSVVSRSYVFDLHRGNSFEILHRNRVVFDRRVLDALRLRPREII